MNAASVGTKFYQDGSVRPFPGLTVVCMLPTTAPQHAQLLMLQRALAAQPWGRHFALLPPGSLHMTVFDLVCDQLRDSARWTSLAPLAAPLSEVRSLFAERVPPVISDQPLRMRLATLTDWQVTAKAVLEPADDATATLLGAQREALSLASGVRHLGHDTYRFHISLAYCLHDPPAEEVDAFLGSYQLDLGTIALPPPQLVSFPDMGRFDPVA